MSRPAAHINHATPLQRLAALQGFLVAGTHRFAEQVVDYTVEQRVLVAVYGIEIVGIYVEEFRRPIGAAFLHCAVLRELGFSAMNWRNDVTSKSRMILRILGSVVFRLT